MTPGADDSRSADAGPAAWAALAAAALALALTALAFFGPILGSAGSVGVFMDETQSVVVALNFVTRLLYSIQPDKPYLGAFYPEMSIGLLSSLPSAIGWGAGGDLLAARLASIAYCLGLWIAAAYLAMRTRAATDRWTALTIGCLVAAAGVLSCPDSAAITMHAQGEISGGAWLAFGYLLLPSRPRLAALVLGLCVWHTKFIFLPFALAGMAWTTYAHASALRERALLALQLLAWFLVPLAAWMILIWLRIGADGFAEWAARRFGWYGRGNSGLSGPPVVRGLAARLASPRLDWAGLFTLVKLRVLILLFAPVAVLATKVARRWTAGRRDRGLDLLQSSLALTLLAFAWWYFFWNQFMWVRHVEPALVVGFAVLAYDPARAVASLAPARRQALCALLAALMTVLVAADLPRAAAEWRDAVSTRSAPRSCSSPTPWQNGPWPQCMRLVSQPARH